MEGVLYSLITFCVGIIFGIVFAEKAPRRPVADLGEGSARACGETFALCTCGGNCGSSVPLEFPLGEQVMAAGGEVIATSAIGDTHYMVSVPAYCAECWTMPKCAKCGKDL
jgi:hypothetical protein